MLFLLYKFIPEITSKLKGLSKSEMRNSVALGQLCPMYTAGFTVK